MYFLLSNFNKLRSRSDSDSDTRSSSLRKSISPTWPSPKTYGSVMYLKRLLITAGILIPFLGMSQDMSNRIGVLTLSDNYDKSDHIIQFLNDDGTEWWTINLYEEFNTREDFRIISYKPDYFLLKLKCIKKNNDEFFVMVNEERGEIKRIKESSKFKLQSWEDYVLDVFSIDFDREKTFIFNYINGNQSESTPEPGSIIVPVEIKDEWMKIKWSNPQIYPSKDKSIETGWIKWKENSKIIVKVFPLS